jgi:hypothetical protein
MRKTRRIITALLLLCFLVVIVVFATSWWRPMRWHVGVDSRTSVALESRRGRMTFMHVSHHDVADNGRDPGAVTVLRAEPWWAWLTFGYDTIAMPDSWYGGGMIRLYSVPDWFIIVLLAGWPLWVWWPWRLKLDHAA